MTGRQAGQAGQAEENVWQVLAGWMDLQPVMGRPGLRKIDLLGPLICSTPAEGIKHSELSESISNALFIRISLKT